MPEGGPTPQYNVETQGLRDIGLPSNVHVMPGVNVKDDAYLVPRHMIDQNHVRAIHKYQTARGERCGPYSWWHTLKHNMHNQGRGAEFFQQHGRVPYAKQYNPKSAGFQNAQ